MKVQPLTAMLAIAALALAGCATPPPPVSHDGLHLMSGAGLDQVYVKPDVDLGDYTAVSLLPCDVSFRADWLRDQNRSRMAGRQRVTEQDMQTIIDRFADSCDRHFREALEREPAYKIVESDAADETVLEIRPAIIDLDLTAPDTNEVGVVRTYTTSSGEMTLFLEAFDAATGEILARVVDKEEDFDDMRLEWTNRATNMADANRYLRYWTRELREGLDAVRAR